MMQPEELSAYKESVLQDIAQAQRVGADENAITALISQYPLDQALAARLARCYGPKGLENFNLDGIDVAALPSQQKHVKEPDQSVLQQVWEEHVALVMDQVCRMSPEYLDLERETRLDILLLEQARAGNNLQAMLGLEILHVAEDLNLAMQEAEAALAPLKDLPGTLGTSKEAFKHGLDTVYASMLKVELPYIYAFLKKTEDGSVAENQEMAARSESLLVKFSAATAFLNPEILAIPAEKLDAWMQDEALATYRHTVNDIVRMRAHTLDAAREQMLALLGDAAGTPKAAFEMLTDVDLQLPMVKNEAGEEVRLTAGTFPVFRESRDRSVREGAFRAMFGTYRQFGDAIAALYGGSVKFDTYSPISAATPPRAKRRWTAAMCPCPSMTA